MYVIILRVRVFSDPFSKTLENVKYITQISHDIV